MKDLISIILLFGMVTAILPPAFSATNRPTGTQNISNLLQLSSEGTIPIGASNDLTYTYVWTPHPEIPIALRTLQADLTSVLTTLNRWPLADPIPPNGVVINIPATHHVWAVQGPFTYEVARWYARAMLMYFEKPGNPKCALVVSIVEKDSEVGFVQLRPSLPTGQGQASVTGADTD